MEPLSSAGERQVAELGERVLGPQEVLFLTPAQLLCDPEQAFHPPYTPTLSLYYSG